MAMKSIMEMEASLSQTYPSTQNNNLITLIIHFKKKQKQNCTVIIQQNSHAINIDINHKKLFLHLKARVVKQSAECGKVNKN